MLTICPQAISGWMDWIGWDWKSPGAYAANKEMTGETPEVRSDQRKPREDRQNQIYHRYHRYIGYHIYVGYHRYLGSNKQKEKRREKERENLKKERRKIQKGE